MTIVVGYRNVKVIIQLMTKYLKVPPRQLVISVSELNEEIMTGQQAKELVRECSYQVISGCLEAYSHYQTAEILLALLPLSAYPPTHLETASSMSAYPTFNTPLLFLHATYSSIIN